MNTIAITFSITEIVILQAGAIILGIAIYFFINSRKMLRQAINPQQKKKPQLTKRDTDFLDSIPFQMPKPTAKAKPAKTEFEEDILSFPSSLKSQTPKNTDVDPFDEMVLQQQKSVSNHLHNLEALQSDEYLQLQKENSLLKKTIEQLEVVLDKKETELEEIKQQATLGQKMSSRIEEVYKEFDFLQEKIADLEKQSREANALSMQLEDAKQSYEQLNKELIRKQVKLEEIIADNQRLHHKLSETEDKLAEANFQRQQLAKKAQLMQEMNNDMQQLAETNKKLQTEIRRIGELESMLNTIEEERAFLLKHQLKNKGLSNLI